MAVRNPDALVVQDHRKVHRVPRSPYAALAVYERLHPVFHIDSAHIETAEVVGIVPGELKVAGGIVLFRHNDENVAVNCDICNSNIFILADKTQLKQVFSNIIKNAIQSIPQSRNDGEVDISARTDEKQITIEIKDNGSGIPADIKERIFTPNFTTKNSGMGLGLAIVKNIVNNNDGDIWFNSEEGKGTTFFVRFSVIK